MEENRNTENLSYNGYHLLDIVSEFNYSGVLMSSNWNIFKTQKPVAELVMHERKALFSILNKSRKHCFNIQKQMTLFVFYTR